MRVISAIALCLALGASADAQNYKYFIGNLDGAQENPPVPTPGSGTGTAYYNPNTDMLSIEMSYSGLVAPTTDAHIHCCSTSVGTNVGVAIGFTGAGGFVIGSTSGDYSHTFDLSQASTYSPGYLAASGGTAELARDRLLAAMRTGVANNSNVAYFNIHTSFRPGGEIRGNIIPFVPEPSSALLLLSGLTLLIFRRRSNW
jgi:hypothetical protein